MTNIKNQSANEYRSNSEASWKSRSMTNYSTITRHHICEGHVSYINLPVQCTDAPVTPALLPTIRTFATLALTFAIRSSIRTLVSREALFPRRVELLSDAQQGRSDTHLSTLATLTKFGLKLAMQLDKIVRHTRINRLPHTPLQPTPLILSIRLSRRLSQFRPPATTIQLVSPPRQSCQLFLVVPVDLCVVRVLLPAFARVRPGLVLFHFADFGAGAVERYDARFGRDSARVVAWRGERRCLVEFAAWVAVGGVEV